MSELSAQATYLSLVGEAVARLIAAERYLTEYTSSQELPSLESAILQVRKSLELVAFSAIAPDKKSYAALRATAVDEPDYTKDYHALRIFVALEKVNPDFYPKPLLPAQRQADGTWHFGEKQQGFLSKKRFQRTYDRLGKHLHAHNPWSSNKNLQNLAGDLPEIISDTKALLHLHARFIRAPSFNGVWVVEAISSQPKIITAVAKGPFAVRAI